MYLTHYTTDILHYCLQNEFDLIKYHRKLAVKLALL